MDKPHFLVVTFPAQGHLNPAFQFCLRLIRGGARVTLVTSLSAQRRMATTSFPEGFSLATFSDGYDDGFKFGSDQSNNNYGSELKRRGSEFLNDLIIGGRKRGQPFSTLVYTMLLPWAAEVARSHDTATALLWIQPAMVFSLYYLYFNGHLQEFISCFDDPSRLLQLPGLPPLTGRDLPSFLLPSNAYLTVMKSFQEQLHVLNEETNPTIFINTFEELEPDALKAVDKVKLIPVGPLIPSGHLDDDKGTSSGTSSGVDLFQGSSDYTQWLDSKPESSVVYVSFGSIALLSARQMEEVARGLVGSGRPFLWVLRKDQLEEKQGDDSSSSGYMEEVERHGMVVPWCSQMEVLSHPSLGCFVTHCGWNSTLESLASGVPVVAFPQWTDQGTNAKLIQDVWKTGVRVVPNGEGPVEASEICRCIELVMGGSGGVGEKLRSNAKKWRDLVRGAVREGGSSHRNLKRFVDEVTR